MPALSDLIDRHGVDVLDHLDRQTHVPVATGAPVAQGDVLAVPLRHAEALGHLVPAGGLVVVAGQHDHRLLADGPVSWHPAPEGSGVVVGTVTVPEGATGWLAHDEHGYVGLGAGVWQLRRQRELAERARLVAD